MPGVRGRIDELLCWRLCKDSPRGDAARGSGGKAGLGLKAVTGDMRKGSSLPWAYTVDLDCVVVVVVVCIEVLLGLREWPGRLDKRIGD